jgi:hypothetical protein
MVKAGAGQSLDEVPMVTVPGTGSGWTVVPMSARARRVLDAPPAAKMLDFDFVEGS